ncbi:MAG TPA: SDR family NAD(P)-dependent oxidoreductase [Steroidobacteraceae bacterium]|jgi:NAD(P)-dependent dehydrogenase (short-subunit alcohol dehydrogenase family)|nr:SDR family NAD(P)-dependent oxidoreductase [Steroidobacteraceae bacterium]
MQSRENYVVVVTGASRGLGRGIARAFGSRGATVYLTARSVDGALAQAASEVDAQGGRGIPVVCDHREDEQVRALFVRVRAEQGSLDILVNNAAAVYPDALLAPGGFWEKPLRLVDMIDVGLRSNYVAGYYAAPLMLEAKRGLIVNISFYGAVSYFHGAAYGAAKAGTDKMSHDMAIDLAPHGVAAVSLWPGFIMTDALARMPPEKIPEDLRAMLPQFEKPEFSGLIIDALYRDPELRELSGKALIGAELGAKYGIKDLDGKQPISYRPSMGSPAEPFFTPPRR